MIDSSLDHGSEAGFWSVGEEAAWRHQHVGGGLGPLPHASADGGGVHQAALPSVPGPAVGHLTLLRNPEWSRDWLHKPVMGSSL